MNDFSIDNFLRTINASKTHQITKQSNGLYIMENTDKHFKSECRTWVIDKSLEIEKFSEYFQGCKFDNEVLHDANAVELGVGTTLSQSQNKFWQIYISQYQNYNNDGISFEISEPSDKYIYAKICCSDSDNFVYWTLPNQSSIDSLNVLGRACGIYQTLKITWDNGNILNKLKTESYTDYIQKINTLTESYTFNIAYQTDIVLETGKNSISKMTYRQRRGIASKKSRNEISLLPRTNYDSDLLKYYSLALLSTTPFSRFIAYYSIIEYCFGAQKSETKQLLNTLKDNIPNLEDLKQLIRQLDKSAINYYQNNGVLFVSEACPIDFNKDQNSIYDSIRDRVYQTRCAVVHNKESEDRFIPIEHDDALSKEIPLVRAIAEMIILQRTVD